MTIFDANFNATVSAPFEDKYQFKDPVTSILYEVVGVFTAAQEKDRLNGAPLKHNVATLELDGNYIDQLDIKTNSIFIINSKNYRVTKTPFIDETGWATIDLTVTGA